MFRKILSVCAVVAAMAFSAEAQFQGGLAGSQSIAMTNNLVLASTAYTWILPGTSGATNTLSGAVAPAIKINNGQNIYFQISFAGTNTGTAANTLYLLDSPDGIHWGTIPKYAVSGNFAGNSAVVAPGTNFTVGALLYLAPSYYTNASGDLMATNVAIRYTLKPGY